MAEVPSPVSWRSAHPRAGCRALRIAPAPPMTIIAGRSGSTSALAIGPAMEITPNVPAMIGVVASCAATVTANGSAIRRGPGTRDAIGAASSRIPAVPRNES